MDQLLSKISDCIKNKNFIEAEEIAWQLYGQNKENIRIQKALGLALLLQGKDHGSIDIYTKVFKKDPSDNDATTNLAHLYLKIEEFEKSFNFCQLSIKQKPSSYEPYVTLVELYLKKREFIKGYESSLDLLKRIDFEVLKKNQAIVFLILDVHIAANKNEEALKLIRYFYQKEFNSDIFYYHSSFSPETIDQSLIEKANSLFGNAIFSNAVEKGKALSPLYFGLANFYQHKKTYDISDEHFIKGNQLIAEVQRYQPLINQQIIKNIKNFFLEEQNYDISSNSEENLIFILGMPRSGTTLVESIIASAKNTISGGELKSINELVRSNYEKNDDLMAFKDPGAVYLNRIQFIRGQNKYFIDKLPGNYHNIGFIKKVFPNSKIIHIQRDPWDNAISLFKQFYVSNIPFASTFFSLGIVYANYEEIMRFWREDMRYNFLTIKYEDLVLNTQEIGNQIFEYCQLPQKYNPSDRGRFFARTASKNQVTKEVHTNSLKKKSFENQKSIFINSLQNQRAYWKK